MFSFLKRLVSGAGESVTVEQAARLLAEGALLIDVRSPAEWASGRARGGVNVPLGELQAKGKKALESRGVQCRDVQTLLLICRSGMRSRMACAALAADPTLRTVNVSGGMLAWQRVGLAMEASR
jgi:rhodanese-related sulfurtransferase